jgi:hypothetical protein
MRGDTVFKKISTALILVLLLGQLLTGFSFAQDDIYGNSIPSKVVSEVYQIKGNTSFPISQKQLSSVLAAYRKYHWEIVDTDITLRDYTGDGKPEIVVISDTYTGKKYLDIFSVTDKGSSCIFSGSGISIKLNKNTFSISNVRFDGRYYYETYTYQWRSGRFLRTGYAKTYTRSGNYEKPIKNDERITVVNALLKARMRGDYREFSYYLSKAYQNKVKPENIASIIPYGKVTAIDIFDSKNGDWVVVVIRDMWGQDRVFKFVPVQEKDIYGSFKIDYIMEIPRAN